MTNTAVKNTAILDEFEQDLVASATIPHCQIINPPNISEAQIQKMKPPFGFFIPKEKAEVVGFTPTADWTSTEIEFTGGKVTEGWLATHIRMLIVHRSQIEVQGLDNNGRYYYIGLAYKGGQITEFGEQVKNCPKVGTKPMFRTGTRMLLYFLNQQNELLHNSPLQFASRGGFGGSFGNELKQYTDEINRVFAKLKGKSGMSFSSAALARVVIDANLGYYKPEGMNPFTCVRSRLAPAIDQVGVKKLADRRDYQVEVTGIPIEELLISQTSKVGQIVLQTYKDYEKFPLPNGGKLVTSDEPDEVVQQVQVSSDNWDGEF